jgi:outer membrane protein TolC
MNLKALIIVAFALLFLLSATALGQVASEPRREVIPPGPLMKLEDFEAMALQRNPTLAQADAAIRAAEGRQRQAGLFPNPVAGYFLEEFAFR